MYLLLKLKSNYRLYYNAVAIMSNKKKKVFVGMSGGVDSSVTAALLKNKGYDVVGVFIKSYNVDGCGEQDADDARRVAEQLKIPFYVFDLEKEYKEKVVQYMIDGYKNGITPNPDVMCNKEIKFGLFLKRALELGADYVATGHYVKKFVKITDYGLRIAKDVNKDQSYFLWTLTQKQLKHCLFPIGEYTKPQVRKVAKKFGLITAEKKDSQGICFLGKVSITNFLKDYIPEKNGLVLNVAGEKIGEHNGAHFYTIGQRHGFNLDNLKITDYGLRIKKNLEPHYIVDKNIKSNTLTVVEGLSNSNLFKKEIELINVNIINPQFVIRNSPIKIFARVRYRQSLAKAKLFRLNPSASSGFRLIFDKAQKFIASGQSAVFYNKNGEMLGGGVIV